jgi:4-hydroxybenzoate polyprenyltransferase
MVGFMRTLEKQTKQRLVLGICLISIVISTSAVVAIYLTGQVPPLWLWVQLVASYVAVGAVFVIVK